VLVAIPLKAYRTIPVAPLAGKIVVDANNHYPQRDGPIPELERRRRPRASCWRSTCRDKVVKAFNAILERDLEKDGRPAGTPDRRALPIAGDDAAAKRIVTGLLDDFGYDAVDAGPLAEGWRFQRAMPGYCVPLDAAGMKAALAAADRDVEVPHGSWRQSSPH
jgi:8-hydroxy-5-deazaflavin:NADPH oxidoreductase